MYARITKYKMKAGTRDAATALMNTLKDQIMGLNGMIHFINAANEDGSGYVVSVIESKAISDANADAVRAIWSNFADHLEQMPSPEGYDVVANWAN